MSVKIAGDLQSGNVIMVENSPVVVLKAQVNKSGRNTSVVKTRTKNLLTGRIAELIFKADDVEVFCDAVQRLVQAVQHLLSLGA